MTSFPEAAAFVRSRIRGAGRRLGLLVPGLAEIREHEPLLPPLLLVSAFSLTAAFSIQPLLAGAMAGQAGRALAVLLWVAAVLAPLLMGAKALVLAVVAWSVLVLTGRETRLRPLASIFLYGEAILALHGVGTVGALHLRGPDAIRGVEDLYVPMGLEGLAPSEGPVLEAVAQGTTVFHLAWIVFLAVALRRIVGVSGRTAWAGAAGAWILSVAVAGVRALTLG